ncbi:hypothetical protein R3P38DRAFT_3274549 [Favolaschia claudopus]|uniref:Transmembrane protein n=1 Tax=Favolaschia claudopus TaxID=2862362 RepID=A0AAW0AYT3_9AGAR
MSRASWHEYLSRSELHYRAAKNSLKESYQAYPFATTTLVVFVATSFVPVISLLTLTVFALCVILAGSLVVLIGAVLGLIVVLSTTLLSSVVAALLAAGVLGIRDQVLEHSERPNSDSSIDHNLNPTRRLAPVMETVHHIISSTLEFLNRRHWTIRVLSVVLAVNFIARTLLGADLLHPIQPSYPLVRPILAVPRFIVHRIHVGDLAFVMKVLAKQFRLFSWKAFVIVCPLYILILAPFRGVITRLAIMLSRSALRVMCSGSLLYGSQLAIHGPTARAFLRKTLAAVIKFLQRELANIDAAHGRTENGVQSGISESVVISAPEEADSTYEMVSPAAPGGSGGDTVVGRELEEK